MKKINIVSKWNQWMDISKAMKSRNSKSLIKGLANYLASDMPTW